MGHRQILALDQKASYSCALYLLAADGYLWDKARDAITMSQVIFPDIQLGGINVKGYILFHLAKDLYYRTGCVKISDLTDRSLGGPGNVCCPFNWMSFAGTWLKADGTDWYGVGRCCPIEQHYQLDWREESLRELIYQRFPLSYGRYIEVFGGGGWVLFGKPPDGMEVYNDYNSDLTNLFRCVRDRPLALIQELGFFPLNGREEFDHLKRFLNREEFMTPRSVVSGGGTPGRTMSDSRGVWRNPVYSGGTRKDV